MKRLLILLLATWLILDWTGLAVFPAAAEPPGEVPVLLEIQAYGGAIQSAAVQDKLLFTGLDERLAVFNLNNPNHPVMVGQSPRLPGKVLGVAVLAGYVYASVEPDQLAIFDISDPGRPAMINSLANVPAGTVYPFENALYIQNQYTWYQSGDTIVDLAFPTAPVAYPIPTNQQPGSIAFSGSRGYFLDYDKTLRCVDFSNLSAPQETGRFSTSWDPLTVAATGNIAAVRTTTGLFIIDFSEPGNPRQINDGKAYNSDRRWQAASAISADTLYIASTWDLEIYDLTQPATPRHKLTQPLKGVNPQQLLLAGEQGVLLSLTNGLTLIDLNSLSSPYEIAAITAYTHREFDVQNGAGFSTLPDNSLSIARLVDLNHPLWSSNSLISGKAVWTLTPGLLFLVASTDTPTLVILDTTHPLTPRERSRLALGKPGSPGFIYLTAAGNYIYGVFANGRLMVIDASDPDAPQITATISIAYAYAQPQINGGYLYLWNEPEQKLDLYTLANPGQPKWAGSIPLDETQYGPFETISIQNYLLLHLHTSLAVYDISNPSSPQKTAQLALGNYSSNRALWLDGTILYAGRDQCILAIDVANLDQPRVISHSPGGARRLRMEGSLLYALTLSGQITTYRPAVGSVAEITYQQTSLLSEADRVEYTFSPGTFNDWSQYAVHISIPAGMDIPAVPAGLVAVRPAFALDTYNSFSYKRISPQKPYHLVITLDEGDLQPVDQASLGLYSWDGSQWRLAPGSSFDPSTYTITANPTRTGRFAIFARPAAGTASSLFLPVTMSLAPGADLSIMRLEINQHIQREDNSVPLVAEKPTMLRIHAAASGQMPVDDVTARVSASRNGNALPGSPLVLGPWSVYPSSDRTSLGSTFNLVLPVEWTRDQVDIEVELDPVQSISESREDNNRAVVTANFQVVPPFKLVLIPIDYTHTPTQTFIPGPTDDRSSEGPAVYYPVNSIHTTIRAPYAFSGDLSNIKDWLRLLNEITDLRRADGAPATTLYYGVVPELDKIPPAIGGIGWIGVRASVGFAGVLTHEGGHNLGLGHAPCGVEGDPNYPYPNGIVGQWGLLVPYSTAFPPYAFDLMSYCGGGGFSDYHYSILFNSLRQTSLGPEGAVQTGPGLLIRAELDANGSASILPIYHLSSATLTQDPGELVTIELLDTAGAVIASHPAGILVTPAEAPMRAVHAAVPLPDIPVRTVRLVKDGVVLAQRTVSSLPSEPLPLLLQAADGMDVGTLRWSPGVPALVQASIDGGMTWQTIAVDVGGGKLTLDSRWLNQPGARFQVILSQSTGEN